MKEKKLNLGIVFGGKSPEHEVSIVTAFQAWPWIESQKYNRFLIYLDYQNQGYLCSTIKKTNYQQFINQILKKAPKISFVPQGIEIKKGLFKKTVHLDAVLLLTHGGSGENGQIQGLLDFFDIPYTGSDLFSSFLAIDKALTKEAFLKIGLKILPYDHFNYEDFLKNSQGILKNIEKKLKYPLFVKPARSGSSIGISKINSRKQLFGAIKKAVLFDQKIVIEEALEKAVDINCAVMGGKDQIIVSPCEQPLSDDQFLSFQEKYLKGGKNKGMASLSRIIPAPLSGKKTKEIQEMAEAIFKKIIFWGMARIDFLYQAKTGKVYPNEINTIPGSLAFYLWQAKKINPPQLVEKMINLALLRKKANQKIKYFYQSEILNQKK